MGSIGEEAARTTEVAITVCSRGAQEWRIEEMSIAGENMLFDTGENVQIGSNQSHYLSTIGVLSTNSCKCAHFCHETLDFTFGNITSSILWFESHQAGISTI